MFRFCSIDYMILSSLLGIMVSCIVISYDIGCQWSKNFNKWMLEYPKKMQLPSDTTIDIGIPNWHVNGHGSFCRNNYSLNYIPEVGHTCGEDVETTWSHTNSLVPSVWEMGPGARQETFNSHWNGWNFHKIVGFHKFFFWFNLTLINFDFVIGKLFSKYFKDAILIKNKHQEAFEAFSSSFAPPVIEKWSKMVQKWQLYRKKPNPYEEPENGLLFILFNNSIYLIQV